MRLDQATRPIEPFPRKRGMTIARIIARIVEKDIDERERRAPIDSAVYRRGGALTCRVSSSTAAKPAARPARRYCGKGPTLGEPARHVAAAPEGVA